VASLSQGRTAAAQCGLFTYKSVPVIFEPPCINMSTSRPTRLNVCFLRYFPLPCIRHKWILETEMCSRAQRVSAIGSFYRPWPPSSPPSCLRGSNGNPTLRVFPNVN